MELQNKNILLGVTGGIAAYKAVELLRLLKKTGANVNVIMTDSAQKFVGKTTFEVLSENKVLSDLFFDTESSVKHIELATRAHAAIIAPATANTIAKLAHGIADDALSTTLLAVTCPVLVCPSMNTDMYQNIRVQRNLDILEKDGWVILDPDSGVLACKTIGTGRLPEPWFIFDRVEAMLVKKDLKGKNILISAGPTIEPLDPVRYISNHSSGKMGYAIARAAEKRGGQVTLVSGPVSLSAPVGVECICVQTCEEMGDQMLSRFDQADIIIKVAAVADYKPMDPKTSKIKKKEKDKDLSILMTQNPDILKLLGKKKTKGQFLVGFAAETDDLEKNALLKMEKKNLDMIAANIVGSSDSGFKADTNKVKLFFKDGSSFDIPLMEKDKVADILIDQVIEKME
ncbi:MAG: bifunctional phosphopantothenoylcysteine decarboxylase/phosphopantothenate--cysteine ligase CoaBC [Desulfobacula sp.]|jgi:phosphopantothenoylcysteine decarboxylase/phosphopantothenate--cysteine ligase|uniref:bifunctional phosphopantothenoylcysteine decarboxylase/phosphopantothenate--cysteine ligase CoaBC n=1 Tax=Desulfobacula sp. TaxID=2593537 RepID=UPI001D521148|nr:bifunctional phosphopantothenoylcysteine decarboxylase/phosphopantothenate--cysteine ligase CoaBC [Desulfobacula sp.]MBT3486908.1 bifunctional phosphopantothenoylcysteine decarboxylase/phosphopantothenate--cysteine ligase CoaBC [Desulfobacula sp.]MBT3805616.1 bifunctional phosphopantothenoylcysteine decarboxylase/phosphopantothenate--cysteine ligase CoaBC [Desulfobacula sp.]MBT4026488.1 bifunctional phosphopantothenoylcysteine decarboxylase/phosphopantothenate--cysteine ligase CoaBC [Desulfob